MGGFCIFLIAPHMYAGIARAAVEKKTDILQHMQASLRRKRTARLYLDIAEAAMKREPGASKHVRPGLAEELSEFYMAVGRTTDTRRMMVPLRSTSNCGSHESTPI